MDNVAIVGLSLSMSRCRVMDALRERCGFQSDSCEKAFLLDMPTMYIQEYLAEALQKFVTGEIAEDDDAWKQHVALMMSLWDVLSVRSLWDDALGSWCLASVGETACDNTAASSSR